MGKPGLSLLRLCTPPATINPQTSANSFICRDFCGAGKQVILKFNMHLPPNNSGTFGSREFAADFEKSFHKGIFLRKLLLCKFVNEMFVDHGLKTCRARLCKRSNDHSKTNNHRDREESFPEETTESPASATVRSTAFWTGLCLIAYVFMTFRAANQHNKSPSLFLCPYRHYIAWENRIFQIYCGAEWLFVKLTILFLR